MKHKNNRSNIKYIAQLVSTQSMLENCYSWGQVQDDFLMARVWMAQIIAEDKTKLRRIEGWILNTIKSSSLFVPDRLQSM